MVTLAGVFLILCVLAIVTSRGVPERRMVGVLGASALVGAGTWVAWWALLFLHIVHIEPLVGWLGLDRLEQPWTVLIFLTPPVVAAVTFGLFAAIRGAPNHGRLQ